MAEEKKGNVIDSFLVALGFKYDSRALDEFKLKVHEAKEVAMGFLEVVGASAAALGVFIGAMVESSAKVEEFAELNGLAAHEVETMDRAAVQNKGSIDGMRQSLQGLNVLLGQAENGAGRGKMIFEKLGLSAQVANGQLKTSVDVLQALSVKMQGMSAAQQLGTLRLARVDPSLLFMLRQGPEAFARMREEAAKTNPLTDRDYKLALEVNEKLVRSRQQMGDYVKLIGARLMPMLDHVLDTFQRWTRLHADAVSDALTKALKALGVVLGFVWDWIVRIIEWSSELYDWFQRHRWAVWLLGIAFGALIAWQVGKFFLGVATAVGEAAVAFGALDLAALLIPIAIGLAIIAFGLLIDDVVNFIEGNNSLIGSILKGQNAVGRFFLTVKAWVGQVADWFDDAFTKAEMAIMKVFYRVTATINHIAGMLGLVDKSNNINMTVTSKMATNDNKGGASGDWTSPPALVGPGSALGSPAMLSGRGNTSVNNSGNSTQTNTFNIQGTDPKAIGDAVADKLAKQQQTTVRNSQSAVGL